MKLEIPDHFVCSLPTLLGCLLLSVSRCEKKGKIIFSSFTEGYFSRLYHSVGAGTGAKNHFQDCILITSSSVHQPGDANCSSMALLVILSMLLFLLDLRPLESMLLLSEPAAERSMFYCALFPEL